MFEIKSVVRSCAGAMLAIMVMGAQAAVVPKPIDEAFAAERKGDFAGLRENWLVPQLVNIGGPWAIRFGANELAKAEEASSFLQDEFERFCKASSQGSGVTRTAPPSDWMAARSMQVSECLSERKEFLGKLSIYSIRLDNGGVGLAPRIQTKSEKEASDRWELAFQQRLNSNGPTGIVETNKGRYRFERFGTLERRYAAEMEETPVEDISSIEYLQPCCDTLVTLRDGSTRRVNSGRLFDRKKDMRYGIGGVGGVAFVLIDDQTGAFLQARFEAGTRAGGERPYKADEQIIRITFADPAAWRGKSAGVLPDGKDYAKLAQQSTPSGELSELIARYELNDPGKLVPAARKRLAVLDTQHLGFVGRIGTQVCRVERGEIKRTLGSALSREGGYAPIYGDARPAEFTIGGYVEGVNERRIKVLIGYITRRLNDGSNGVESLNELQPKYTKGQFVWDDARSWSPCQ